MTPSTGQELPARRRVLMLLGGACAAAVAGCSAAPDDGLVATPAFQQQGGIALAVSRIEVVEAYTPPLRPPNVEHNFPITPAQAARVWVDQRLRAAGGEHFARVTIRDASVVAEELPGTGGLRGLFVDDQNVRYHARLQVEIEIRKDRVIQRYAFAVAEIARSRTLQESASVSEREETFQVILDFLVAELDREMTDQIKTYLHPFVV